MNKLIFLVVTVLSSMNIQAMQETGNGGDVIVCRNEKNTITSVELLDFYEARTLRGIDYNLGGQSLNVNDKMFIALKRLERLSFQRATTYFKKVDEFFNNSVFLSGIVLTDVPDSNHSIIPAGCDIEQIVIQRKPTFPEDKKFTVNKDLWDKLDNDNKAGLILHEVIFDEALSFKHKNSIATRYFNSYLTSLKIEELNIQDFINLLSKINFYTVDVYGALINLEKIKPIFYENGTLKEAEVVHGSTYIFQGIHRKITKRVSFYDNQSIKQVNFLEQFEIKISYGEDENRFLISGEGRFYSNGSVERFSYFDSDENDSLSFRYNDLSFEIKCPQLAVMWVSFWPNGMYKNLSRKSEHSFVGRCNLTKDTFFYFKNDKIEVAKGSIIHLWESGSLAEGTLVNSYTYKPMDNIEISIPPLRHIGFSENGTVLNVYHSDYDFDSDVRTPILIKIPAGTIYASSLHDSYNNGMPNLIYQDYMKHYYLNIQGREIEISRDKLELYSNGHIKKFTLAFNTKLINQDGIEFEYQRLEIIKLNEDGFVI